MATVALQAYRPDTPFFSWAFAFKAFSYMFTRGSLRRGDVNDVIYDPEGRRESEREGR